MSKKYLFADEAGCFTFKRGPNISKYFIICTVSFNELSLAEEMNELRRKMVWNGDEVADYFHATSDKQAVRDQVYALLRGAKFKIQATICEKSKANPKVTKSKARFYKYPWYYQLKHSIAPAPP